MNIKTVALVLLGLNMVLLTNAQTWAPKGAKWTFGVGYATSPAIDYTVWTSTGDSLVAGHLCKIIRGRAVGDDLFSPMITYEDSNRIYIYDPLGQRFTTLYDFNKNAGETWTFRHDTCDLVITVDSTGIDTINGYTLKTLYLSSEDQAFDGKILEHIGHTGRSQPGIVYHCYGEITDMDYYLGLRCYEDSIFGFHSFGIAPSCDYTVTGITTLSSAPFEFKIFPNPAVESCALQFSGTAINYSISLFDIQGQLLAFPSNITQNASFNFNTSSLSAGMYSIRVSDNRGNVVVKKMLKL
ncbi:MAG: hypothetical protein JWO06_2292 [Bacteroidota bacterium]|nr:hypothetical protein [Bacteroidota bacterium]